MYQTIAPPAEDEGYWGYHSFIRSYHYDLILHHYIKILIYFLLVQLTYIKVSHCGSSCLHSVFQFTNKVLKLRAQVLAPFFSETRGSAVAFDFKRAGLFVGAHHLCNLGFACPLTYSLTFLSEQIRLDISTGSFWDSCSDVRIMSKLLRIL